MQQLPLYNNTNTDYLILHSVISYSPRDVSWCRDIGLHKIIKMAARVYQHQPLVSDTSIRVLDLLPSRDRDALIQCRIRQVTLGSSKINAKYEALSYVWGARQGSIPIACNGEEILVTPNCRDALVYLRRPLRIRTLWIDAICVDQQDTPAAVQERTKQIPMMGEVYRQAKQVVVWLGACDLYTNKTFRYLKMLAVAEILSRIGIEYPGGYYQRVFSYPSSWLKRSVQIRGFGNGNSDSNPTFASLLDLVGNAWFSRIWTTEEVAFSKRCTIMCGHKTMDWGAFAASLEHTSSLHHATEHWELLQCKDGMRDATLFAKLDDDSSHPTRRRQDVQLLNAMCMLQCGLPHDKVYGLYAVFAVRGVTLTLPDYTKPLVTVFEEFAKAYIDSRRSLEILRNHASC